MDEQLQEFVDSHGASLRVDRARGVLRGVKVLGLDSRNGRVYLPRALAEAAALYEGCKVNVNHPKGDPLAARGYEERIGCVQGVVLREGEGLFCDLHFNPKHALAEQLMWDAEHAPQNVGFSHNVLARTARQGERTVVEAILKVNSVDLVADPATTRGLFESQAAPAEAAVEVSGDDPLPRLTLDELRSFRPDLVQAIRESAEAELTALRGRVEALSAAEAVRERHELTRRLLAEHRLPDPERADAAGRAIVGETLLAALAAAPDEPAMRLLIEERARLVASAATWHESRQRSGRLPESREQRLTEGETPLDAASFARALR